jgi:hypothetical protein
MVRTAVENSLKSGSEAEGGKMWRSHIPNFPFKKEKKSACC